MLARPAHLEDLALAQDQCEGHRLTEQGAEVEGCKGWRRDRPDSAVEGLER